MAAGALVALTTVAGAPARAAEPVTVRVPGGVYATVTEGAVVLGNEVVERRWARDGLRTTALVDKRRGGRTWSRGHRDFTLSLTTGAVGSESFRVESVEVVRLPRDGLRAVMRLGQPGGTLTATRTVEAYPDVAGFRTQTTVTSSTARELAAATLDELAVGESRPTLHAFRAGADWRNPDWPGPAVWVGYSPAGDWRETRTAGPGAALEAGAQWVSTSLGRRSAFMVMERNDFPSSRAQYDGQVAVLRVDWSRDVVSLGPFEGDAHVESPGAGGGRRRLLRPGVPFRIEPAFTGVATHADDEPWQFHRYLAGHRMVPYPKAVIFNSYRTQDGSRSTGAHDDMDFPTMAAVAPIARRLGVETFVLDDGWQSLSGDWEPNSPEHPDPRWDGVPGSKLSPRYPDSDFRAARDAIAPMRLGLWMSPLEFHPSARVAAQHPEWRCEPFASGVGAQHAATPNEGSNESGIIPWSTAAIADQEARVRRAIERWGVRYFKFDFMVWLDCAGQGDLYDLHDQFLAMVDRLQADHPEVTFQLDDTNDYRLFPFESISRGPLWFQNGTRPPDQQLHNLWSLSPWLPPYALGQHVLGGEHWRDHPVDTLMAAALLSHLTVWTDLRKLPDEVVAQAAPWVDFYKRHRSTLAQMTYPLLDDPLRKGWTALQPWDPEAGRGALLAFRQDGEGESRRIALRNVPPGRRFTLREAPSGRLVGSVTSEELTEGLRIELPRKRMARVLLIDAVGGRCRDRVPPRSRFTRRARQASRSGVRLGGRSRDRGCGGRVRRVRVALGRAVGSRCRWLSRGNRFGPPVSCLRTRYLPARGTRRWTFRRRVRLVPGRYTAWVRGIDAAGNVERKARRRNLVKFVVR